MTEPNALLAAALRLALNGWAVLPLKPGRKEPLAAHGCNDATSDPATIEAWWRRWPQANVGVATGAVSGLVVLDIDGPDGEASWAELVAMHGQVEALEQKTGRPDGGRQLFFAHPGDKVQCRTGVLPGIDVRGDGGYVVVPPSLHPSGRRYEWTKKGLPDPLPAWLLDVLRPTKRPKAKRAAPTRTTCGATSAWGQARLDANAQAVRRAAEGSRNATLNVAAFKVGQGVGAREIDEEHARDALLSAALDSGLEEVEARKTIASGLTRGAEQPQGPASPPGRPGQATVEVDDDDDAWRPELLRTQSGAIKPVLPNAVMLLRNLRALRGLLVYDTRYLRPEWSAAPPWDPGGKPRPVNEADPVECSRWLAARADVHVAFGHEVLWTVMGAEAQRRPVDRVRAYLDGLTWDEQPRINTWLEDLLGVEPSEEGDHGDWSTYVRAVGPAWLISAIARAVNPGCQADHMIVLEGEQGALKSSSIAALGGPYYADLALDVSDRDAVMGCHGPWIIEWSELAGLGRREAESVKAFLTRRTDRFRAPYGRHVDDYPRSCVFAGTTNEGLSLTDSTGNRRYWPLRVGRARPEAVADARDQLWAEALFRYNCGEHWWLSLELERVARAQQEARLELDAWADVISDAVERGSLQGRDFVATSDLYSVLQLQSAQQTSGSSRRLSHIMSQLGWKTGRDRIGGAQVRGYARPGVLFAVSQVAS
jgi:predicted P-loop ATPase